MGRKVSHDFSIFREVTRTLEGGMGVKICEKRSKSEKLLTFEGWFDETHQYLKPSISVLPQRLSNGGIVTGTTERNNGF